MLCLYDRLQETESLLNAHEYPPMCMPVHALPQARCDDNESETPLTGPSPITAPSYITGGTYRCGSARFL